MTILVEDRQLLEAFRRGETSALGRVYDEYARGLFGLLSNGFSIRVSGKGYRFNGLAEPWQLEAAVQEIFLRAFADRSRIAYDGLRPYKNYLFMIARNYVIDLFRKKSRQFIPIDRVPEPSADPYATGPQSVPAGPEDLISDKQLLEQVDLFIESLDPKERALFDERFTNGRTIVDTAQRLNTTDYRIKRDEKKIKRAFFRWMKNRGYFEGYRYRDSMVQRSITMMLMTKGILGS